MISVFLRAGNIKIWRRVVWGVEHLRGMCCVHLQMEKWTTISTSNWEVESYLHNNWWLFIEVHSVTFHNIVIFKLVARSGLLLRFCSLIAHIIIDIKWTVESRTVRLSNNLKLDQKIRFETRIKIRKSNHKRGIEQHRAAHPTVSQQIRPRLGECCWSFCASARPVLQ